MRNQLTLCALLVTVGACSGTSPSSSDSSLFATQRARPGYVLDNSVVRLATARIDQPGAEPAPQPPSTPDAGTTPQTPPPSPSQTPDAGTTPQTPPPSQTPDAGTTPQTPPPSQTPDAGSTPQTPPPQTPPPQTPPPQTPPPQTAGPHSHKRCGWIGAGDAAGVATFVAHATWFDAIHPDWYAMNSDGVTVRTISGVDDAALLTAARANHVLVIPMVASVESADYTRAMLNDPARRTQHVKTLVALAQSKGYDGLDLDYEHLWSAADRAPMTALLTELATAMHAAGKSISAAVPPIPVAAPGSAWDLPALAQVLDTMHIMGYDLHSVGTHEGPVAPLGWIDAVAAYAEHTGHPEKFVLGMPNYGVTASWFAPSTDAIAVCGGDGHYATTSTHMATCPFGPYAPGRTPHCSTPHGELYFDDTLSLEEKVQSAATHHLAGITYWTVGSEPPGFFDMVLKHYAR